MIKTSLFVITLLINAKLWATETSSEQTNYKTPEQAIAQLNQSQTKSVSGPFLLPIKAIKQHQLKVHLHTSLEPKTNIIIEVPSFIQNHYKANSMADLERVFLNHKVLVIGVLKTPKESPNDDSELDQTPTVKLLFTDQLSFYD